MSGVTFDGWETQFYGDCLAIDQDSLAHFRTKGSKNGVRRYQNRDGTWTPLGLRERRIREGFGEERAQRKAEKKAARAAERSARAERMAKFKAERAEEKRKRNPKNLTDAELKRGIERLKMEQEYRELRQSPLIKVGAKLVEKYMNYRVSKMEAAQKREDRQFQYIKMRTEAETARVKAKADIAKAKADTATAKANELEVRKGNKAAANKAKLVGAKLAYRNTTIRGGIGKMLNKKFSALGDYAAEMAKSRAKVDGIIEADQKQNTYAQRKADRAAKRQQQAAKAQQRAANKSARKEEHARKRYERIYGYSGSNGRGPNLNR